MLLSSIPQVSDIYLIALWPEFGYLGRPTEWKYFGLLSTMRRDKFQNTTFSTSPFTPVVVKGNNNSTAI